MTSNFPAIPQSEPSVFVCPHQGCGRRFRAQFSLNRHAIIHSGTKRFTCEFCGKGFSLGQYLREHQYRHTRELPYECGIAGCTRRFRQAGKLSLHRKTHPEYVTKKYNYSLNEERRTKPNGVAVRKKRLCGEVNLGGGALRDTSESMQLPAHEKITPFECSNNPVAGINPENKIDVRMPLPGQQDIQEHTLHSPSMKAIKQLSAELGHAKPNSALAMSSLEAFISLLSKVTSASPQRCSSHTHFSTLDLFSLVNNFKH